MQAAYIETLPLWMHCRTKEKVAAITVLVLNPEHYTTLTQEIRWRWLEGEVQCFGGMGGGQVSVVYDLVWLSDRGEVWRKGGERQPCAFEMEVCGSAMQRGAAPSSHKSVTHQNHIITTFSDTLISCFTRARKTRAGWGKSLRKRCPAILWAFSLHQTTICYWFWVTWNFKQWQLLCLI